jgi:hypothetical protein
VALLAAVAYAIFAHGATAYPGEARLQVALALLALATCVAALRHGGLRTAAPASAWLGLGLLAAFAAWSGLTLAWSVAPAGTWVELNRAIAYALAVAVAMAAVSWQPRALAWGAIGFAGIALVVALYALGGKLAPDVRIEGLVDLNHTRLFARLREPLEYWNALALVCAMAVPIYLRLAVDEARSRRVRIGSLAALSVLLVTGGLTYSRGGVAALVVAVGAAILLGGARLRSLGYLALAAAAAAAPLALGFTADDLTAVLVPVSERRDDGLLMALLLLGGIAALAAAARFAMELEARTAPDPARSRRIGRGLAALLAVCALGGVAAIAASDRGLTGTVDEAWESFRSPKQRAQEFDPGRLLSTTSGNRWVWWTEAVGAWSDRPIAGWGAGSFPVLHREYRSNELSVLQPHSVPLQFLAETGLVGAMLALGGIGLLLVAAVGAVRRLTPGPERGLAAGALAAAIAWLAHGLYDWDWDIPGVTLPAMVLLGLLAARGARGPGWSAQRLSAPGRVAGVAAATLVLATVALSSILPSWARTTTDAAVESVGRAPTPAQLRKAQQDADFAARLDPLSIEPLLAAASIADRRDRVAQARRYLVDAVERQPRNVAAWMALARFELTRGNQRALRTALSRALELDPNNQAAPSLLGLSELVTAPAALSATATGTPLVAVVGETPRPQRVRPAVAGAVDGAAEAADPSPFGAS